MDSNSSDSVGNQPSIKSLKDALLKLSAFPGPLFGISTLRGEMADNMEWKIDPARPSVIVGTVDMIGSKLLFSGYGDRKYWRAQHAGLLGQDTLIVHDEAHLTPSFGKLLKSVVEFQKEGDLRPMRVMELSATQRYILDNVFRLESEDESDTIVKERLSASKELILHQLQDEDNDKRLEKIKQLALAHEDEATKVLIYINTPEDVLELTKMLKNDLKGNNPEKRVIMLSGVIRGLERDRLIENEVFREFLNPDSSIKESIYLVSTSAGEVGVDIDADHMITDLTTLDSLIQRMGRVNRRGEKHRESKLDLVSACPEVPNKPRSTYQNALMKTWNILKGWSEEGNVPVDVSPKSLQNRMNRLSQRERDESFSPSAEMLDLDEIILDSWAFTSIDSRTNLEQGVGDYLHGNIDERPTANLAWRLEVSLLCNAGISDIELSKWFEACSIGTHEIIRDRSECIIEKLNKLLKAHRKKDNETDFDLILLDLHGNAQKRKLSEIVDPRFNIDHLTVILPTEVGGFNKETGTLDPDYADCDSSIDVTETYGRRGYLRERLLETVCGDNITIEPLSNNAVRFAGSPLLEKLRVVLKDNLEDLEENTQRVSLILKVGKERSIEDTPETALFEQTLERHQSRISGNIDAICAKLDIDEKFKIPLHLAAKWHDMGKSSPIWQCYACNCESTRVLAKSKSYQHWSQLSGYRHEFGSMIEASNADEIRSLAESDLILHLIAAHHGWARPHFEKKAWDNRYPLMINESTFRDSVRRFEFLQRRYGRWGLAWLESLIRCADIAASAEETDSHSQVPGEAYE